ncbi:MAG: LysR family transcriptional regulator [Verrucomicrobia bacterium]|nr:LysR family transcriptional regulator [Verrucomicrobiota bacterium]
MNVHHLELFYYVARHGGITEAVRNIPYGIQQPAVSSQIIQLEQFLGVKLLNRRPFELSTAGKRLSEFITPFFSNLDRVADEIRGGEAQHLRIGASATVLRDHLPELLQSVRKKFSKLKLTLFDGHQPETMAWLEKQEIDLAVTLLETKMPAGTHAVPLLQLPLVLLVERNHPLRSAAELWKQDQIEETLITLPPGEAIVKNFQVGLSRLGVDWFSGIKVSSLDLVETYAANGFGIGLSVAVPKARLRPEVRALPLPDFPPVALGVVWRGKITPLGQAVLDELKLKAQRLAT